MRKLFILILLFSLYGCGGVSYPKGDIIDSLKALVKKECGAESEAFIVGRTLYLDMPLEGLTSKDQSKVNDEVKKMQTAIMAITRVTLSTDADVKYMVVNAFSPDKSVLFRILQNIDDVKSYLYMRISRGDYQSRSLFEIEGPETAASVIEDRRDITEGEFVGRMIVAQINMAARANPFIGALISMMQLRYHDVKDGVLYLTVSGTSDEKGMDFIRNMIADGTKEYSKKYALNFESVKIIDQDGNIDDNYELQIESL